MEKLLILLILLLNSTGYAVSFEAVNSRNITAQNSGKTESNARDRVLNSIALKTELGELDKNLAETVVSFTDPVFEECVRTKLGKHIQAITSFEISGIFSMKCSAEMKMASMFKHMSHKAKVIVELDAVNTFEYELIRVDGKSDYVEIRQNGFNAGRVGMTGFLYELAVFIVKRACGWSSGMSIYAEHQVTIDPAPDSSGDTGPVSTDDPYDSESQTCNDDSTIDDDDDDTNSTEEDDDAADEGTDDGTDDDGTDDTTTDTTTDEDTDDDDKDDDKTTNPYDLDYDNGYGAGAPGADQGTIDANGIGTVTNKDDYDNGYGAGAPGTDQGTINVNGVGTVINKIDADELVENASVDFTLKIVIDSIIGVLER